MSFITSDGRAPERLTPGTYSLVYRPTPADTDIVEFEIHGPVGYLRRFQAQACFELLQLIEPDFPDVPVGDDVLSRLKAAFSQATASFMRTKIEDEGHLPSEHLDLYFDDNHVALAHLVRGSSPLPVPEDYAVVGRFVRPHAPAAPPSGQRRSRSGKPQRGETPRSGGGRQRRRDKGRGGSQRRSR
jgi:hypothetical protein